ncbi:MAG: T9SS type A sorting domain-containing protein [Ignavibacteria bacterium]
MQPHNRGWDFNVSGIYRANGMPITSCDLSGGPHRGTIYINWSDQRNGVTDTDVFMIKSTDGGNTWSEVKRVNDDPAGRQQFFTWMTIDQSTGYLYFVYYDRRNYTTLQTDVYMAKSTDGGETFENFKVSATPFTPNSSVFFGDYTNITAANNKVRPIWARLDNNTMSLYTAIVDIPTNIQNLNESEPATYKLYGNFPNPFNPVTKIKFDVVNDLKDKVRITIYDMEGKEVGILVDGNLIAGTYEVEWDGSDFASGTYFCKMETGSFSDTISLLLIK